MKKEITTELKSELEASNALIDAVRNELASSEDFILSYIKTLAIMHGGGFNLDELKNKYGWKMVKVMALSAAINHFVARGLIKRGATVHDVQLK